MSNIRSINDYLAELEELSRTFKLEAQRVMGIWQHLNDIRPKIVALLAGHRGAAPADGSIQDALSKVQVASTSCEAASDAVTRYVNSVRG